MISRALKQDRIAQTYGRRPFLIRNEGIYVTGTYDMKQGKKNETDKSPFWHSVLPQVHDERYHEKYRSYMLQVLLVWEDGMNTRDYQHHNKQDQKHQLCLVHIDKNAIHKKRSLLRLSAILVVRHILRLPLVLGLGLLSGMTDNDGTEGDDRFR